MKAGTRPADGRHRMRILIYRETQDGVVTVTAPPVEVSVDEEEFAPETSWRFPPCQCPRCRPAAG